MAAHRDYSVYKILKGDRARHVAQLVSIGGFRSELLPGDVLPGRSVCQGLKEMC